MDKNNFGKLGYFLAIIAALTYGLQVVVGKLLIEMGAGAKDLLILQYTGATVVLFFFLLLRRKKAGGILIERKFIFPIIAQGVLGCCGTSFFFYLAMEKVNAGVCSMLLYLCPVYVCLFFMITGIRKINRTNKISVAMAFVGAIMVLNIVGLSDIKWSAKGLCLGFIAGILYAFYGIYSDLKLKAMPVEQMLFYMYLVATITIWILNPGFISDPIHIEGTKMWGLIILVVVLQVLPMSFLNLAIRMIGSNRATVIATAELPFTVILAFFILGEQMALIQIVGILMITGAVALLNIKKS